MPRISKEALKVKIDALLDELEQYDNVGTYGMTVMLEDENENGEMVVVDGLDAYYIRPAYPAEQCDLVTGFINLTTRLVSRVLRDAAEDNPLIETYVAEEDEGTRDISHEPPKTWLN